MASERFQDSGAGLGAFADEFLVECPSCGGSARVSRRWENRRWSAARLVCARCGASRPEVKRWSGPVVLRARRRCMKCGRWLEHERRLKSPPHADYVTLSCAGCGEETRTSYDLMPITAGWDAAVDACFGLPLWLQTRCSKRVLWAYNPRHLAFLKAYLSATLREKHPIQHASAAQRLPGWIKRHRVQALRAVARLEKKLA